MVVSLKTLYSYSHWRCEISSRKYTLNVP